ncbi:UDP-glucose/GDP-mannose dehydrogenase family protein [Streptomyces sp. SM12]|uniref:UDP-glucose dehydrogenase family protein n=1 Tax=Streptomyces sp. SM12 TaxID=1071602 RepID=UPI000CD4BED9|nr:UDP-glucose/GDP-mannose dehydrogenase family protein [Streptomyces sp. SM12]
MKVTVIGIGRLGAPYAAALADIGHDVLGVETDPSALARLQAGQAPFDEPGLAETIGRHTATGRMRFTHSYEQAVAFADLHFVCVPTPQKAGALAADLSFITAAVTGLAQRAQRDCLIVAKSSVPVGTTRHLGAETAKAARPGVTVRIAYSPDFLRESTSMTDAAHPSRIVVGIPAQRPEDETLLRAVWDPWVKAGVDLVVTDLETAELAKSAANGFLAAKISYINFISALCEKTGADIRALAHSMGLDPRIGPAMLDAGLGFGGSCIPKDLRALYERSVELHVPEASILRGIDAINIRRRRRVLALTREAVGGTLTGTRIAIWGAAFKPGTDDIRDSPALAVALDLHTAGADVSIHDPKALPAVRAEAPQLRAVDAPDEVLDGTHVLLHLTNWETYQHADPAALADRMAHPAVIDARGALNATAWRRAGWSLTALGTRYSDGGRHEHPAFAEVRLLAAARH